MADCLVLRDLERDRHLLSLLERSACETRNGLWAFAGAVNLAEQNDGTRL